jgi:hypothetical protein
MPAEMLTYGRITDRLSFSSAFEALVNLFRLPRQRGNDGNGLTSVDLAESPTAAVRSSEDHQSVVATLTARIETPGG